LEEEKYFKKWYDENKGKLSEKRKEKYEKDSEYREKRRNEARRYYWMQKRRAVKMEAVDIDKLELKPNEILTIEGQDRDDVRYGMEFEVPVYYTSAVAKVVSRSSLTVRLWFLNGYLDEVGYRNVMDYRMFTRDQLECIAQNVPLLKLPSKSFAKTPFFVRVNKCFAELNEDKLKPMKKDEWRFDLAPCPWCSKTPSLQKRVGKQWKYAQCFECVPPGDSDRDIEGTVEVDGKCDACGKMILFQKDIADSRKLTVLCDKCGRKLREREFVIRRER